MNDKILIEQGGNYIYRYTCIDNGVKMDRLIPSLMIAQTTQLRRVLTDNLYDKIVADFDSNPALNNLLGIYQEIYQKFALPILVFYATSDFIIKNSFTVANGGNLRNTSSNSENPDRGRVDETSKYYRELAASFELEFYDFMKDKNVPEYQKNLPKNNTYQFPWYLN